jgi:large subunit ribosomal protein L25
MSRDTTLNAELREGTGKGMARKLRAEGRVPAVVYGGDGETQHISLDAHDAEYLFHNISVDNTIVDLAVAGEKEPVQTLVREIQTHPWKATLLHVDFLRIQQGVAIDVDVPVHLVGIPVGVKDSGGVLEQIIHDLPMRCIPSKIPEVIEVDVSGLEINDVLHISDISFDEGVEVTIAQERTICSVSTPRAEIEEEPEEAEEPELVGEGAEGEEVEGEAAEEAGAEESEGDED